MNIKLELPIIFYAILKFIVKILVSPTISGSQTAEEGYVEREVGLENCCHH